jgi:hypothetical protein
LPDPVLVDLEVRRPQTAENRPLLVPDHHVDLHALRTEGKLRGRDGAAVSRFDDGTPK